MVGERVEEQVAGIVVRLLRGTDDRRERGERDEVIEVDAGLERCGMQMPGAEHLRVQDLVKALLVEIDQEGVIEHHGAVDDALECWEIARDVADHAANVVAASDVTACIDDVDT